VEAQTYERWELVVVDDASTDGTGALLASLDDPRIVVVAGEGEGCTGARNRALDVATGELVTYLDDDNVLHPRWLEAVVWGFTRRPDVDVLYGARIADDHGRVHGTDPTGTPWVNLLPWDRARAEHENLADMGALAHRAGLPEARFDPTLVCSGDWDLLLRLTQDRDPLVLPAIACIYATDTPGRLSDEHGHEHWDAVVRGLLGTPLDRRPGLPADRRTTPTAPGVPVAREDAP
jgi:glycosyltransferase involved in cell wall biosynthesis